MGKLLDDPVLRNRTSVFADRAAAGKRLGGMLRDYRGKPLRLFAIPAGGVPVAAEIARDLSAPLDLVIVRKIQLPWTTEAGFGALDPDGKPLFNEALLSRLTLTPEQIAAQVAKTAANLKEREEHLRGGRPYPVLSGATTIIVDDGLASGYTMQAAVGFLKRQGAGALIVAVPTALDRSAQALLPHVDLLVCPNLRSGLSFAVADAYENWYDVEQDEVLELLAGLGPPQV
jgi:putative phosphoribosyl transferase|uniref:Phosphoribosyltransferase n=1 Tax=Desulfobacca acetoxidans TaxID=60893 RepID=A0A7V6DPG7_9BACT